MSSLARRIMPVDGLRQRVAVLGGLIKFSHTVFALPFAGVMLCVVSRDHGVRVEQGVWIVVAMVCARTAAMAYNRWLDREIDSLNPRTCHREIPTGRVSPAQALALCVGSSVGFLIAARLLGWHCVVVAPFVLVVLLGYSWMKRFSSLSHVVLGLALAAAPGGVWYALTGELAWTPVWLMTAVLFWVAGFDVLYACQDQGFDRAHGLRSIPARVGSARAFIIARLFHLLSVGFLLLFAERAGFGVLGLAGVLCFAAILASQYRLVTPTNLERIDTAFFDRNALASVTLFLWVLADVLYG